MLGQSSGQSPRASTSSRPSALSASGPNTPPLVDSNESTIPTRKWALERPEEGVVASGLAEDELQHRRRKPRSSGGFLLQTARVPPSQSRFSWNGTSEGIQDVKGKRRAEEGDLTVPKRAIARQGQHRKPSLGSSPLATEVLNIQHVDHGNADESTGSDKSSSAHTKSRQRLGSGLNSNGISTESTLNGDQPRQAGGERAFGQDTDPALIVNLALNLSESRRRNFSSGGLLIPRDAVGTRRIISSGYPTLASSNSTNVASLRQYLQQPHQLTQNVSPRLGKSGSNRGTGSPLSQDDYTRSWQSTMLPAFEAGLSDKVVFDACDATFSRAEKARVALELSYEYRRLLQYLPAVPTNPKSKQNLSKSAAKQHVGLSDHLSMTYNPLQYIRNRKVRFRERRPLDAERDGWKHIERVRRWVDVVADNREDGIHRADRRFPLPPFEPMKKCEPPRTDGIQSPDIPLSAGARSKESGRPRMDWEVTSWDLLADAYWLQQGDNMYHIEDSSGQKIMQRYGIRKETTSRASIESNRSFGRRSKSMVKESVSPERVQALAASIRQDSLERGRRGRGTNEPKPPSHDGNGSQDRKGMWSKRFVRSRSSSTSSDSIRDKRRRHGRGRDLAGSHEDLHTAALEKQMMDMLAKEAEHNRGSLQDSNDEFQTAAEDDSDQHYRGTTRNSIPYFTKRRPSAPQRMMTEMPVTEKTQIPARTSLDEQRLHHRKSSDDFDSTAPNSPTATGFVPSIAINLSPPASPPKSAVSPKKMLPSRLGSFKRNRSRSISRRAASNCDPTVKASTMSDVSRQTTNESHYRNRPTMERSTDPDNGLLSPVKIDPPGNNYRPIGGNPMTMIKTASGPESKIRGMFKRGRIAELLGNEVSKVGGMLWNKDSNNSASTHSSPISSYASEDSDLDDEDMSGFDNSPKDDMSPFTISNEMMGKPAQVSTRIDEPKYHMSNLPSFRLPFNRDYPSLEPMKISPDHDPVTRQQLAQRERGRSSRFDRLAPPKIDMEKVSPLPSRNTSPVGLHGRGAHNEGSHGSSSGRSDHRVRSADRRLNAMLGIPGKVGTGLPAPTGLSAFESRPRESPEPPNLGEKRQWTISDQGVSAVHGTINRRDIARVRALLLSSGVKANEIARRAEEVPDEPSQLLQNLQGSLKGLVPNVARSQEHTVVARLLINKIETTTKQLRSDAEVFSHTTVETLHDQSKAIDEHVTYKLTPLVRAFADDADSFSAELTTTHTLAVKQLNDRVNAILRARRRRLRWVRRGGWAVLEWTLLGIMWMAWLVAVMIRLIRCPIRGFITGVRWLFCL